MQDKEYIKSIKARNTVYNMKLFGMINSDPEIVALKKEIKERTGFV